jgi:hypothetical protein
MSYTLSTQMDTTIISIKPQYILNLLCVIKTTNYKYISQLFMGIVLKNFLKFERYFRFLKIFCHTP